MENVSKQPPGFRFHLELLFLPCLCSVLCLRGCCHHLHLQSCWGLWLLLPKEASPLIPCWLQPEGLHRFLSWSCLNVGSSSCCPCSCFLTLQWLSVFPQPLNDLLSSVLKCGRGLQGFPASLPALLSEGSVELFMVSWFNQVLKVAPFLSLLHIRLLFLLDFSPYIWSLFSGSGIYFSNVVFFPLITVREMKSVFRGLPKAAVFQTNLFNSHLSELDHLTRKAFSKWAQSLSWAWPRTIVFLLRSPSVGLILLSPVLRVLVVCLSLTSPAGRRQAPTSIITILLWITSNNRPHGV